MPENYDPVASNTEFIVTSATTSGMGTRFTIRTKPSGVVASFNYPVPDITPTQAKVSLDQFALLIESAMAKDEVIGAYGAQDTDDSGLLTDYVVLVVGYETLGPDMPGPFTQEVWLPAVLFTNATAYGKAAGKPIADAMAVVNAIVSG
jgi:hypothetical protein